MFFWEGSSRQLIPEEELQAYIIGCCEEMDKSECSLAFKNILDIKLRSLRGYTQNTSFVHNCPDLIKLLKACLS